MCAPDIGEQGRILAFDASGTGRELQARRSQAKITGDPYPASKIRIQFRRVYCFH